MEFGIYILDYYFWQFIMTLVIVLATIVLLGVNKPTNRA